MPVIRSSAIAGVFGLAFAQAAAAATLDIGGRYGDEAGCAFDKKPEYTGENDFVLLTPTEWRTAVTGCDFARVDLWQSGALKRYIVTGLCASEGEGETTIDMLRIEKASDGSDSYVVFDASGNEMGRGKRCQ